MAKCVSYCSMFLNYKSLFISFYDVWQSTCVHLTYIEPDLQNSGDIEQFTLFPNLSEFKFVFIITFKTLFFLSSTKLTISYEFIILCMVLEVLSVEMAVYLTRKATIL
jgi:hypothetical protein